MESSSKIYVAGHTGLVGSAILRVLNKNGYKNVIVRSFKELDLTRQDQTEKFFEKERPDYVFLAAAKVGGILANSTYKAEFIYDNLIIATNVIHSSYKYGVKKLLNLGSSCIYPKLAPQPLKEEYLLSNYLEPTNEPYAIAKIVAIKLCRYYNEQYGTNFISVMPTNLYGPGDNFNLETAHVLPSLIRKFHLAQMLHHGNLEVLIKDLQTYSLGNLSSDIKNLDFNNLSWDSVKLILQKLGINEGSITLWGTGIPLREFLYVDDLAKVVIFLMEKYDYSDIGEIINIGCGQDLSIKELAQLIAKVIGFTGSIYFDDSHSDGTMQKKLDISKLKSLGWKPAVSLEIGIQDIYNWYLNNQL